MAANGADAGCLHACKAAADDENVLGRGGGNEGEVALASAGGVDRAGEHLPLSKACKAALLAGKTRPNICQISRLHLVGPVGVCQKRTAEADEVAIAPEALAGHLRIVHTAGQDDGHGHGLFHQAAELAIHPRLEIHGRMVPVPRVIGAGVHVEHVIAGLLEDARRLEPLLDVLALLLEFLAWQRAFADGLDEALETVAQRDRVVLAADLLDALHDVYCGAQAVLEASAIFVVAVVVQ